MARKDQVWANYRKNMFGVRQGCQKAAKAVQQVSEEITHDILWGLKPTYVPGVVLRRRNGSVQKIA